jgi:hypothetical protein
MLFTTSHRFDKESGTAKTTKTSKKKCPEDFILAIFVVFVVHLLQSFVGSHKSIQTGFEDSPPYPKSLQVVGCGAN